MPRPRASAGEARSGIRSGASAPSHVTSYSPSPASAKRLLVSHVRTPSRSDPLQGGDRPRGCCCGLAGGGCRLLDRGHARRHVGGRRPRRALNGPQRKPAHDPARAELPYAPYASRREPPWRIPRVVAHRHGRRPTPHEAAAADPRPPRPRRPRGDGLTRAKLRLGERLQLGGRPRTRRTPRIRNRCARPPAPSGRPHARRASSLPHPVHAVVHGRREVSRLV